MMAWQFRRIGRMLTQSRMRGQVDRCDVSGLYGWAFAADAPERRLDVLVEFEQETFHFLRADRYRADVHKAGLGHDGYCGFQVPGRHLKGRLPLRVIVAGEKRALPTARPTQRGQRDGVRRIGDLLVRLDTSRDGALSGTVAACGAPDSRRLLRLETREGVLATTRACLYRPRAPDAAGDGGLHDDHHGFTVDVPSGVDSFRLVDEEHGAVLYQRGRHHAHRARR